MGKKHGTMINSHQYTKELGKDYTWSANTFTSLTKDAKKALK
jgi:hypothetical protein